MTETPTPPKPLEFELCYRKAAHTCPEGTVIVATLPVDTFTRNVDKDKDLPDRPAGFTPMRGTFRQVHERAKELNDLQTKSGFLFYFYFPESVPTASNPGHCSLCARAHKMREPEVGDAA